MSCAKIIKITKLFKKIKVAYLLKHSMEAIRDFKPSPKTMLPPIQLLYVVC